MTGDKENGYAALREAISSIDKGTERDRKIIEHLSTKSYDSSKSPANGSKSTYVAVIALAGVIVSGLAGYTTISTHGLRATIEKQDLIITKRIDDFVSYTADEMSGIETVLREGLLRVDDTSQDRREKSKEYFQEINKGLRRDLSDHRNLDSHPGGRELISKVENHISELKTTVQNFNVLKDDIEKIKQDLWGSGQRWKDGP